MTEKYHIRPAQPADEGRMLSLLPQLADFNVPAHRNPKDLWSGDATLLSALLADQVADVFCDVLADADDQVCALALVSMREELMSHAPSAHLEALVVAPQARGAGLGRRMLDQAETHAKALGAESITLHVFANNQRARSLYDAQGYDSELIRAIKWFDVPVM